MLAGGTRPKRGGVRREGELSLREERKAVGGRAQGKLVEGFVGSEGEELDGVGFELSERVKRGDAGLE